MKCTKCGADCRCLAGESAHPDNWFCPQCDRIAELEAKAIKQKEAWDQHMEVAMGNAREILKLEAEIFTLKQYLTCDQLVAYEKAQASRK
jgi:hypothetical protein